MAQLELTLLPLLAGCQLAEYEISLNEHMYQLKIQKHLHRADLPGRAGVPALAADKVATGLPADAVRATGLVGVGHGGRAVRPPGEEVAIVGALLVGGDVLALGEGGGGDDTGDGRAGGEQSGDGNHCA